MHTNYYFLRQLSSQLKREITGYTVVSCFSQNKEELIIELNNSQKSFFIKASMQSQFCCLAFPESFNRARKNSVDLFSEILMKKITGIRQFTNERSFSLELEDSYQLVFKMHGNRSNLVLFQNNKTITIFRNHLKMDLELSIESLDRTIDFSREQFDKNLTNLPGLYVTFGKVVWEYWNEKGFDQLSPDAQWNELIKLRNLLENPSYYIIDKNGAIALSLVPFEKVSQTFSDPISAINEFFSISSVTNALHSEKAFLRKQLQDQVKAGKNYIAKNQQKLNELVNDQHYQIWGDLIMAHMHEIKIGMQSITLESFYDGKPVEIKLKPELNAQKNAEVFYRKAKNQQIEINKLKESIQIKQSELNKLNETLISLEETENLKSLRKNESLQRTSQGTKKTEPLPYHEFEYKGFKIWVGKNAEKNDELTLKHSYKEDLWLHAKDVAGSHVIIKHQSGKNFPKEVIERAAQLAAYNSKRKTETLCPVCYTPKKFVRKRKGDPAGAVVVEKENVIMVEPKL
ncbi:MAG TPA: NFACT RNA binding domain-containing protein [Cyclobacteriaceae bacterium]|nr:NFACT RNA binding domain-containing protein [Cyclobacteriaceae bacterium]